MPEEARERIEKELQQAEDDVADGRRGHGRAQLHRLDALAALAGLQAKRTTTWSSAERDAQRGPLRPGEAQGAHRRVPRRAGAGREDEGPDPVLRRASGRRQDLAGQVHRPRHRARLRAHLPGRRARRGGDPRPPPHLHRRAARQDHPVAQEGRQRTTRSSCSTRSTRCRWTSAATPRRRCSRCSIPSRTTPSTTTTSTSTTTSRDVMFITHGEHAAPHPACRCRTAWRSSSCRATPRARSSRSRATTWCRSSSRRTASSRA